MNKKQTDSIPRASIEQIMKSLVFLTSNGGKGTFEQIRVDLQSSSGRKGPSTRTASWTVARDVLTELQRLGFAKAGILPRKLSDVDRLRETPCEALPLGEELSQTYSEKAGRAYDELLLAWMNEHPYFRAYMSRVIEGPLYIPDITSTKHLGETNASGITAEVLADSIAANVEARLKAVAYPIDKQEALRGGIARRITGLGTDIASTRQDKKRLIDLLEDSVLIPSLLEAEGLPLDGVTFQHLTKCSEEFYSAAWTSSHPGFEGRILFSTCDLVPNPIRDRDSPTTAVAHHGIGYASPQFAQALLSAYDKTVGASAGYADAYILRAFVCIELRIQPQVFAGCLDSVLAARSSGDLVAYTELPFSPPPAGETYVEVGRRRIGRLKLTLKEGA